MRPVAVAILLCSSAFGQTKKTRPFVPPDLTSYLSYFYIAKDEGCAKDYARTVGKEGLELRKMLAELERFGCIEYMSGFVWKANVIGMRSFGNEKTPVKMSRVTLILDSQLSGALRTAYPSVMRGAGGGALGGFVLDSDLHPRADIEAAIRKGIEAASSTGK